MSPISSTEVEEDHNLTPASLILALIVVVSIAAASSMTGVGSVVVVAAIAVLTVLGAFRILVALPTLTTLRSLTTDLIGAKNQVANLEAQVAGLVAERERNRRKVARLGGILAATHHELNREITMLGFAVDDVVDEASGAGPLPEVVDNLKIALDHVEEGQRNVSALSRLGTNDRVEKVERFTASDIVPLTLDAAVFIERNDPVYGDVELWRLFVKNAARNSEAHGQANVITMSSGAGRLAIADDGVGCSTAELEQAWKAGLRPNGTRSDGTQIMRRIAEAHGAQVTLHGEVDSGVRIMVDLNDFEVDLRERGAIEPRVRTPHKASGGRVSSTT
ncbi:MAG: hypothetical protein ACN4GZ_20265 [Acidimicrobiales bacterium]